MLMLMRIAWRNIWRQRRRTLITAGAMAFGVAVSMCTIALSIGVFDDMFRMMVRENMGHVQIHHPDYPKQRALYDTIPRGEELLASLDSLPEVAGGTGRLFGYALLGAGEEAGGAQLIGVLPAREDAATGLGRKTHEGRFLASRPAHEIVLGAGLAESLKVGVGGEVVAVTQAADGSMGNDLYQVVGIATTGSVLQDRAGAWMHLADLQELLVLPDQLHEIALVGRDDESADALAAETLLLLQQAGHPTLTWEALNPAEGAAPLEPPEGGLLVRTWNEINPMMAQILSLQDASVGIVLLMVFSVAALGILNTMLMSVLERTKELGVMVALGLKPRQVVVLVLLETLALAAVALVAGVALGLVFDGYLAVWGVDFSFLMGSYSWAGVAFEPVMYGIIRVQDIVATGIGLFVISLLAALWPALQAARLQPVDAMRQE